VDLHHLLLAGLPAHCHPMSPKKIAAKSLNLATATHQTSHSKPIETPPSALTARSSLPRRDERP
jgi:hypothetical protein